MPLNFRTGEVDLAALHGVQDLVYLSKSASDLGSWALVAVLDGRSDELISSVLEDPDPELDARLQVAREGSAFRVTITTFRFEQIEKEREFIVADEKLTDHERRGMFVAWAACTLHDAAIWSARAEECLAKVATRLPRTG